MKTAGIIGYGRFGELLASLFKQNFRVTVIETSQERARAARDAGFATIPLRDIGKLDIVVFAVPISAIAETIKKAAQYVAPNQLVLDVCSVKVYLATLMEQHLSQCQLLATHPMFGPDSAANGVHGLQVAICPITASDSNVQMVVGFWQQLGAKVVMTTPENHDKDAAYSQAFSYSIARILLDVDVRDITLKTRSFELLAEVGHLSAKDSGQLFHDMLYYNPYFKSMKQKLFAAIDSAQDKLDEIEKEQDTTKLFAN